MAPNLEARHVEVVASEDPYADDTQETLGSGNIFSLKWTVGDPWWQRSR